MLSEKEINEHLKKIRARYGDPERDENRPVDLIPAAWEWICPHCYHYHREIEWMEHVTCAQCGKRYPVADAGHAWG
jgi:hypothetical protein